MQFVDLIFFAMIAVFLILRLRSVLGRRMGDEPPRRPFPVERREAEREQDDDNVIELPTRINRPPVAQRSLPAPIESALAQVRSADASFSADGFLVGARAAFSMIITAFAMGDKQVLRPLLSDAVFNDFVEAIDARTAAEQKCEVQILGTVSADISAAEIRGRIAFVTVRFASEQVNTVRDREGRLVEGDPDHVARVIDIWTFSRDLRTRDPNWALVETRSGE